MSAVSVMRVTGVWTLVVVTATPVFAADACSPLLTSRVWAAVAPLKDYQLPLEHDNADENIAYDRKHGGTGCLGAAQSDFDGDGVQDVALLLSRIGDRNETILAVVLHSRRTAITLHTFEDVPRDQLAVGILPPGTYVRTESVAPELEPGEVHSIRSVRPASAPEPSTLPRLASSFGTDDGGMCGSVIKHSSRLERADCCERGSAALSWVQLAMVARPCKCSVSAP